MEINAASILELQQRVGDALELLGKIEGAIADKDAEIAALKAQIAAGPSGIGYEQMQEMIKLVWSRGTSIYDPRCQQLVHELKQLEIL